MKKLKEIMMYVIWTALTFAAIQVYNFHQDVLLHIILPEATWPLSYFIIQCCPVKTIGQNSLCPLRLYLTIFVSDSCIIKIDTCSQLMISV